MRTVLAIAVVTALPTALLVSCKNSDQYRSFPAATAGTAAPDAALPLDGRAVRDQLNDVVSSSGVASESARAGDVSDRSSVAAPETDGMRRERVRLEIDNILSRLDRQPGETPAMMFFRYWGSNPFVDAATDRLSTFAVDVDTASYTLLRGYLFDRTLLPPIEAVRTEEFVNYFDADLAPPAVGEGAFAIHASAAPTPLAHEAGLHLLRVGLKAHEVSRDERKAASLVFVVDTSGSMRGGGRLELVKEALRLLVAELDEGDTIGIVAFNTSAHVVLEPTPASENDAILSGIAALQPGGSTNVHAGLTLGYDMASRAFLPRESNRVILLSDGVANTSITDRNGLLASVGEHRGRGIWLTTVGVGMGNHNDYLLEQLADGGNGQCVYVDRLDEARRVFVENLTGTLQTVAKDTKVQVEFEPAAVRRYRQLGYENRAVADADFRNDRVDAGEVGAGHEVSALWEVEIADGLAPDAIVATVRVRYLTVEHGEAVELKRVVRASDVAPTFEATAPRFQLAAYVAEFAEVLRDSYWSRSTNLDAVAGRVEGLLTSGSIADEEVKELVAMMRRAAPLVRERESHQPDEVEVVVHALQENNWDRARARDADGVDRAQRDVLLADLERQNSALRGRLEALLQAR